RRELLITGTVFAMCAWMAIDCCASEKVHFSVTDSVGEPEAYATVRIYHLPDTVKPVLLDVTDQNGKFSAPTPKENGKYRMIISSIGKSPLQTLFTVSDRSDDIDAGTLVMRDDAAMLAEVEIVAQKPLVNVEIDRIGYDVQADEEARTVTIFDMLRKVPMVTVDGEENVKVKGGSNFKIFKNGRPNSSWSRNPKEVFKSIPASIIKRIEVITEPGAKYDAEGVNGILNIVTMDHSVVKGVMGNVYLGGSTGGEIMPGMYVSGQYGKFSAEINIGGQNWMDTRAGRQHNVFETRYTDSGNVDYIKSVTGSNGGLGYGNLDMSYEVDTLNLITLSFGGYFYKLKSHDYSEITMSDAAGNLIYGYDSYGRPHRNRYFDFDGKLDYQHTTHRKGETLTLSYLLSTTNSTSSNNMYYTDMVNMPVPYDYYKYGSSLRFFEHTFQVDWTRPIGKCHKIETGAKYILRLNDSDNEFEYSVPELNRTTDFRHTTQVGAVYAEYAYNSTKWGARAGLRYEFSHLNAKYPDGSGIPFHTNLSDLVPTLSISYKLSQLSQLKLNFSTRINRPGISYLNPAVNRGPSSVSYGNPDLESARNHSVSLTYSLTKTKVSMNIGLNGGWTNNQVQSVQWVEKDSLDNDVKYSTYGNLGNGCHFGVSAYMQWQAGKKTTFMLNGQATWMRAENKDMNLRNSGWGGNMYINMNQKLPWKMKLNVYGGMWCSGASGFYDRGATTFYYHGLSLQRSFLKEDRLTVSLRAANPFGPYKYHMTWRHEAPSYTSKTYSERRNWSCSINVSYRFGSFNAQVKKANTTIKNDDLQGRK
ncbi:MAG: TonB-dependent receptor family protein, partial [Muribaculaceae bacterium]|nr:TonB-dependent receptor family protein [Muribaculaceae bacterium]